jgi:hypothetical protein
MAHAWQMGAEPTLAVRVQHGFRGATQFSLALLLFRTLRRVPGFEAQLVTPLVHGRRAMPCSQGRPISRHSCVRDRRGKRLCHESDAGNHTQQNGELPDGALFVDGVQRRDVERRRLVQAANHAVKQNIGVFKEPRERDQDRRDTEQAGLPSQG